MPHRYSRGVHTVTESSDEASRNELSNGKGCTLENGADDHDDRTNEDGTLSTQHVSEKDGNACTKETAERVATNCNTLNTGSLGTAPSFRRVRRVDLREESVRQHVLFYCFEHSSYLTNDGNVSKPPMTPWS